MEAVCLVGRTVARLEARAMMRGSRKGTSVCRKTRRERRAGERGSR